MEKCDFFIQFLQTAQSEICKKLIDIKQVNQLFQGSLKDPKFKSILKFQVVHEQNSFLENARICFSKEQSSPSVKSNFLLEEERITVSWSPATCHNPVLNLQFLVSDSDTMKYQLVLRLRIILLIFSIQLSHARLRLHKHYVRLQMPLFIGLLIIKYNLGECAQKYSIHSF